MILVGALLLRLEGLGFGLPAMLDPDEPLFLLLALRLLKEQTLNPGWFGHPGTITIYCLALIEMGTFAVGHLLGWFPDSTAFAGAVYQDPAILVLPGRSLIVACGIATIALTFLLTRKLFGTRAALIAAATLAICPIHIRYSQIIRTDMQSSVFIMLELLLAVYIARRGGLRGYVLAGIVLALACATKWPAAACAICVFGAALLRWFKHPEERGTVFRGMVLFAGVSVVSLAVVSPYLIIDFETVISNLQGEERPYHLGATGHGFFGNVLWYLKGPFLTALGPLGLVGSLAGAVIGARRSNVFAVTVLPVFILFMAMISAQALVWERWIVPLLPLAAIAFAVSAVAVFNQLRRLISRDPRVIVASTICLLAIVPVAISNRGFARERAVDTRTQATAWARDHIPEGSTVTVEHMAFDVLQQPWRFLFPAGDEGCVDVRNNLADQLSYSEVGTWRGSRAVVDIGTLAPDQLASCRGDWAILTNWDRYRAEADRFPREVENYQEFVEGGTIAATFRPAPGRIGGPIVRVVRLREASDNP